MRHLEWLNINGQRSYPIKEDCSQLDVTGNFKLPNELLVDAVLAVDANVIERVYIYKVVILPDLITITLAQQDGITIGAATAVNHTPNAWYLIQGYGDYKYMQGKLVLGDIPNAVGTYEFSLETAELEPTVIIPNIRGVTSLGIHSNNALPLTGHVKLEEGFNIRLSYDYARNAIRIDAIEGAGLGTSCVCPEENIPPGDPIKFINGIGADDGYNFNVQGVGCISVTAIENGIKIENTCEEVCCDCEDMADLQDALDALLNQLNLVDGRVRTLENC
jgi:hypothetical protein